MTSPAATFYALLGVAPQATPDDIRMAYRRLAQKYHPDKYRGRGDAVALMAQLNKAYEVLSDPQQRAAYDRDMATAAAGGRRRAAVPLDLGGKPWYLLWFTLSVILLTLGFVALKALSSPRSSVVSVPLVATPALPDTNAAAAAIKPWTGPPPRPVPQADDPVARLVRDGVIDRPVKRPSP
jgi:DnaJ domain